MDPIEFLELAEELVERKTPCACRTAIGRAYYGALNVASKLLRDAGVAIPKNERKHQIIWQCFINCGIRELEVAGSSLSGLQGLRNDADYKMDPGPPEQYRHASYHVTEAREHIETIKRSFQMPARGTTVDAIVKFREKRF